MVNKSGIRGSKFERDLLDFFRKAGLLAERLVKAGSKDQGDLVFWVKRGNRPVVVEAKALRAFDLAAAVTELNVEKVNYAEARGVAVPQGVAILKRPGKPIAKAYVVMELDSFLEWINV